MPRSNRAGAAAADLGFAALVALLPGDRRKIPVV